MWDDLTLPAVVTPLELAVHAWTSAAVPALAGDEAGRAVPRPGTE
jgi:hypothetical protein